METVLLAVVIFLALNTATSRFQVRGASMLPTLHNGQYLVISKLTYWIRPPQRGDIIVFRPPTNPGEEYIKRIVGLPGEQVEIREGEVAVNGQPLDEPYVNSPGAGSRPWTLSEGEYFVLGDNRRNSSDSRQFGPISEETIVGRAWVSYWPPESWSVVEHHSYEELAPEEG
jgi:signal peptidase I